MSAGDGPFRWSDGRDRFGTDPAVVRPAHDEGRPQQSRPFGSTATPRPVTIPAVAGDGWRVFDGRGIGPDGIAWIQRDLFIYYVEFERALVGDGDWIALRVGLVDALTAALGLDCGPLLGDPTELTDQQIAAGHMLDQIRATHDPDHDWIAFREAIWQRRQELREP